MLNLWSVVRLKKTHNRTCRCVSKNDSWVTSIHKGVIYGTSTKYSTYNVVFANGSKSTRTCCDKCLIVIMDGRDYVAGAKFRHISAGSCGLHSKYGAEGHTVYTIIKRVGYAQLGQTDDGKKAYGCPLCSEIVSVPSKATASTAPTEYAPAIPIEVGSVVEPTGPCCLGSISLGGSKMGYVVERLSGGGYRVMWDSGKRYAHCNECIKAVKPLYAVKRGDKVTIRPCKLCGGKIESHWESGKVIGFKKDEKGSRIRVEIKDAKRKKGYLVWLCCPMCIEPYSEIGTRKAPAIDNQKIEFEPVVISLKRPGQVRLRLDL